MPSSSPTWLTHAVVNAAVNFCDVWGNLKLDMTMAADERSLYIDRLMDAQGALFDAVIALRRAKGEE